MDHHDIYSIVDRLRILEEGLDKNQKSVNQLSATFKPKTVAVLTAPKDPKNPMAGKLVGGCEESEEQEEALEEAVATEDTLSKVKASFADYLQSIEDNVKKDSDIKEKSKVDRDLSKKDKKDHDLIAKDKKEEVDEDTNDLHVGDPIIVVGSNEFKGKSGEISEFSPSGKFVVVKLYNHGEHSMHLSDVEYNKYADDQDVNDAWTDDEPMEIPVDEEILAPSHPVKTVTNGCGLWEIHGNEPKGFEIRYGNRTMKNRFKSLDEAEMALEMFVAHRSAKDESADYIEEA